MESLQPHSLHLLSQIYAILESYANVFRYVNLFWEIGANLADNQVVSFVNLGRVNRVEVDLRRPV